MTPTTTAAPHFHQLHVYADQRTCVASVEYLSARALAASHNATRALVERRWEVSGRGRLIQTVAGPVIAYPRCGFTMTAAWYGVVYERGVMVAVTKWRAAGAFAR
jgi:hypothetical protein